MNSFPAREGGEVEGAEQVIVHLSRDGVRRILRRQQGDTATPRPEVSPSLSARPAVESNPSPTKKHKTKKPKRHHRPDVTIAPVLTDPSWSHGGAVTPPPYDYKPDNDKLRNLSVPFPLTRQVTPNFYPSLTSMAVLLSLEGFKAPSTNGRRHVNQDRGFIHEVSASLTVFAVFDGHGERGHDVSQYVSSSFQELLTRDFPKARSLEAENGLRALTSAQVLGWLRNSFSRVDKALIEESNIDCTYSGCTASVAIRHLNTIYVAYIGDSKVAGFQFHGKRPFCLVETPEHSPAAKNELARIRGMGASVSKQHYQFFSKSISRIVEAGLSVSRAFGDLAARPYGLISEPDFVQIDIPPLVNQKPAKKPLCFPLMLIVASDGLWDTISPYEVLDFVSNSHQSEDKLFHSLRDIAEVAWRRRLAAEGRSDDTTAILALLL